MSDIIHNGIERPFARFQIACGATGHGEWVLQAALHTNATRVPVLDVRPSRHFDRRIRGCDAYGAIASCVFETNADNV